MVALIDFEIQINVWEPYFLSKYLAELLKSPESAEITYFGIHPAPNRQQTSSDLPRPVASPSEFSVVVKSSSLCTVCIVLIFANFDLADQITRYKAGSP